MIYWLIYYILILKSCKLKIHSLMISLKKRWQTCSLASPEVLDFFKQARKFSSTYLFIKELKAALAAFIWVKTEKQS